MHAWSPVHILEELTGFVNLGMSGGEGGMSPCDHFVSQHFLHVKQDSGMGV